MTPVRDGGNSVNKVDACPEDCGASGDSMSPDSVRNSAAANRPVDIKSETMTRVRRPTRQKERANRTQTFEMVLIEK
jgi:hypothetical protein